MMKDAELGIMPNKAIIPNELKMILAEGIETAGMFRNTLQCAALRFFGGV
jgi:hypothetical protein